MRGIYAAKREALKRCLTIRTSGPSLSEQLSPLDNPGTGNACDCGRLPVLPVVLVSFSFPHLASYSEPPIRKRHEAFTVPVFPIRHPGQAAASPVFPSSCVPHRIVSSIPRYMTSGIGRHDGAMPDQPNGFDPGQLVRQSAVAPRTATTASASGAESHRGRSLRPNESMPGNGHIGGQKGGMAGGGASKRISRATAPLTVDY